MKDIFNSRSNKIYVESYSSPSEFPQPKGNLNTIYIDTSANTLYIWNGSSYVALNIQTIWGYQDFAAGVITSTSVTLTANENGTNAEFTPANFYNYAAIYRSDNTDYVYTSGFFGMFAGMVAITVQSGVSITLNKIPDPATTCRIWYLFKGVVPTTGYIIPPENILDSAAAIKLDSFFLAADDLSAVAPITYDSGTGIISTSMATNKLIGRSTAATGVMEEVIVGSGLELSGTGLLVNASETNLTFSDIITNNTSAAQHGLAPKLSDTASEFLNGQGNWTTPAGIVSTYISQSFSAQTSIAVIHDFGVYPEVQALLGTGEMIIPSSITHNSVNDFTVVFTSLRSGTILATVGSPQRTAYITVSGNYTVIADDRFVDCDASGSTITLLSAVGIEGLSFVIKNSSLDFITIDTTLSQDIDGDLTFILNSFESITVVANGANWRIN